MRRCVYIAIIAILISSCTSTSTPVPHVPSHEPDHVMLLPSVINGISANNATVWSWNGAALSNSVVTMRWDFQPQKEIRFARLICVWTPQHSASKVRLIHMDDGPTNITEIAQCASGGEATPIVSGADITADLNALRSGGVKKHLGWQTQGNGSTQFLVYKVAIEIDYVE